MSYGFVFVACGGPRIQGLGLRVWPFGRLKLAVWGSLGLRVECQHEPVNVPRDKHVHKLCRQTDRRTRVVMLDFEA